MNTIVSMPYRKIADILHPQIPFKDSFMAVQNMKTLSKSSLEPKVKLQQL